MLTEKLQSTLLAQAYKDRLDSTIKLISEAIPLAISKDEYDAKVRAIYSENPGYVVSAEAANKLIEDLIGLNNELGKNLKNYN